MKVEVERSCLDCNYYDIEKDEGETRGFCQFENMGKVPEWIKDFVDANTEGDFGSTAYSTVYLNKPYINCPAWEGKEGGDD